MASRADELVREIEQTRTELTPTLVAVGAAVSPKRNIQKAKAKAAGRIDDVKARISPARVARRKVDELKGRAGGVGPNRPARLNRPASGRAIAPADSRPAPAAVAEKARDRPLLAGALAFTGAAAVAAALRSTRSPERSDGRVGGKPAMPAPKAVGAARRKAGDDAGRIERGAAEAMGGVAPAKARSTRARAAGAAGTATGTAKARSKTAGAVKTTPARATTPAATRTKPAPARRAAR